MTADRGGDDARRGGLGTEEPPRAEAHEAGAAAPGLEGDAQARRVRVDAVGEDDPPVLREHLLARLVERHAISEAIPFENKKAIEDLACYLVRAPFSVQKPTTSTARRPCCTAPA